MRTLIFIGITALALAACDDGSQPSPDSNTAVTPTNADQGCTNNPSADHREGSCPDAQ